MCQLRYNKPGSKIIMYCNLSFTCHSKLIFACSEDLISFSISMVRNNFFSSKYISFSQNFQNYNPLKKKMRAT